MLGYQEVDLIGQPIDVVVVQPSRIHEMIFGETCSMESAVRQMTSVQNSLAVRKDGTDFPVDISLNPIETELGNFVLASICDATERKRAELAQANNAAIERLMLVGQLSGGVAHEIRTPLSVIRNDVYFLQSLGDRFGPDAREAIQEISEALGKATRIVNELLDFTRQTASQPISVRLSSILAAALMSYRLPSSVKVLTTEMIGDCFVQADPEQIERILINLLRNAVQAMREKGTIEIRCGEDDQTVWLEVIDDGPGVIESDRHRVFDPLFTTKATGIGLGLAISLRYAKSNRGDLTVCNRSNGGACFRLSLPRGFPATEANDHE
jgi:PAS domain S-box-containing protein